MGRRRAKMKKKLWICNEHGICSEQEADCPICHKPMKDKIVLKVLKQ